jgi:porphobilinogen synthase
MVRETTLSVKDFIFPLFVKYGADEKEPIPSMPGQYQFSVDSIVKETEEIWSLGIPAIILFGLPDKKDAVGSRSYAEDGVVQRAISAINKDNMVDNDATLEILTRQAVSHARAGADFVGPSDMMDGRVAAIRKGLDENNFHDTGILSYAVKYASAFFGPFREAADSAPQFGDRSAYQMDPPNALEAIKEVLLDMEEGADMIMVKPALPYLDIVRRVREECLLPLAAYNVSGEYAMVKAADQNGWMDGTRVMMEILYSIKRAGADLILTYFAKEAAAILNAS